MEGVSMQDGPHSVDLAVKPDVTAFFDADTNTISYVVRDLASSSCAVIDSVRDFDYASARVSQKSADAIIAFIRAQGLTLEWIIETHVHADHLSAAPIIRAALGGKIGIGDGITVAQDSLARSSTMAPSSGVTAASSTACSRTATPTPLAP